MDLQSTFVSATQALKTLFQGVTDEMQMCILNCTQCHQVCEKMIQHCLSKGGAHAEEPHIRLMQDCAQICAVSADFMLRGSPLHFKTCQLCAEICTHCAQDCERLNDDDMMQMCIDTCKRCAETCSEMSSHQFQ